jgi:hypothetical protein
MLTQTMDLAVRRLAANRRAIEEPNPRLIPFNLIPVTPLRTYGGSRCDRDASFVLFYLRRSRVGAPDESGIDRSRMVFPHVPSPRYAIGNVH